MPRRRKDGLEGEIERALSPGRSIGWSEDAAFVRGLEAVEAKIDALIAGGEGSRAAELFDTFLAACYQKADEVDGSSGSWGMFVGRLFCDWIRARQACGSNADETVATLLGWIAADNYGYSHQLEDEAVKVMDGPVLAAFERAVRERRVEGDRGSYEHSRRIEMLKAVHRQRQDVAAYAALCEEEKDLAPKDCEILAEMALARGRYDEALSWVDRGREIEPKWKRSSRNAWGLDRLRREILGKLGRGAEALASAWEEYERSPSVHKYQELMKFVPAGLRGEWHERAMKAIDGAELRAAIEVLTAMKEGERLAGLVESATRKALADISHVILEPAAKALTSSHPLLSVKMHVAMADRILDAKKSKYYGAALRNLALARKIFLAQGRDEEWRRLVDELRARHSRKSGFMPGLERLVGGRPAKKERSFLEEARVKWKAKTRRT